MKKERKSAPAWLEEGRSHVWHPYAQMQTMPPPLPVARTEGCRIVLADGKELIDGVSSWWSAVHGYNHPHLIEAAKAQLDTMPHVMFAGLAHEPAYTLAARLSRLTPGWGGEKSLKHVFFSDSGSTAVEVALKMALQYWNNTGKPRKDRFICLHRGYHGDTFGAMAVSDPERGMHKAFKKNVIMHYALEIPSGEYSFAEFAETLKDIAPQCAGLIMEPLVQGAGGMLFHSPDTLAEIHRLCHEHEVLFIADEIMTGFGRTGSMFACEEAGIIPDIMCVGKALTGGVTGLAATLATGAVYEAFLGDDPEKALMHGPTYMANPLACAVANASLDLFAREPRLEQAATIEAALHKGLRPLRQLSGVFDVRVKGAIGVVQLAPQYFSAEQFQQAFVERGVWVRPFGDIVYLMPPLTISPDELNTLICVVCEVITAWAQEVRQKVGYLFR